MEVVLGGERNLDLLPAEFQQQEPMRDFLERLFGLLDTGTAQVENVLARRDHLLDPRLTSPSLLSAIETWLGMIRSEEHTSELQSLMRISYAVFCLKKKKKS